ncbi:reverse transcriptase domain-containing protein [Tanacetum coccineum]|uniref:Reverse transcriptase domain-containing protein n=1 Tax=Tanacetum coccineum TaxID=301880 RepID=A0ABQ5ABJ8_9ASTR
MSGNASFTFDLGAVVLTGLSVLIDAAPLGELCLTALTGTYPDFVNTAVGTNFLLGTDISKITRKPSKTGKHGHGKRKSTREAKDSKPKPEKVKLQSKKVNPGQTKVISQRTKPKTVSLYSQNKGLLKIEGYKRQSKWSTSSWQGEISQIKSSHWITQARRPRGYEESTRRAIHKELGDRMEMAATIASSLEAEQDSVDKQSKDGLSQTSTLAFDNKHIGEEFIMSSIEIVYRLEPREPLNKDGEFGMLDPQLLLGSCWLAEIVVFQRTSSLMSSYMVSRININFDTFYNSLNTNDQDALDSVSGGNFLNKIPRDGLAIIESKSKVHFSRSRAIEPRARTLLSQTVTNPRQQINAITTRSGKTLEGPSTPLVPTPVVSNPQKEPEQNPETSTEKVQNPNLENTAHVPPLEEEDSIFMEIPKPKAKKTVNVEIQDLNSPRPNSYQSKLPYPERIKVRENDKPSAQHSRFLKMFKQLRLEIGLKDALVEMPKFNKWLSSLLRNKEKLEEIAITTVNAECSAIIMNKVPEKLEDPGKFLIPCALQELDRTSALADSGASINLLPHSILQETGLKL